MHRLQIDPSHQAVFAAQDRVRFWGAVERTVNGGLILAWFASVGAMSAALTTVAFYDTNPALVWMLTALAQAPLPAALVASVYTNGRRHKAAKVLRLMEARAAAGGAS